MEVRQWDSRIVTSHQYQETELIKTVDVEMYKDIDFGGFIVIDGKSYRHCMYDRVKNVLYVEPTKLNEEAEEIESSQDFECPYCGNIDSDAWELDDEGETCCSSCRSVLEYERVITVEYNIKPKKCSLITRF